MIDFKTRIHDLYHINDINCARTTLICLSEELGVELAPQVQHAAIGMHGAGRFRAQCGLVEGALMFIGVYGSLLGKTDKEISALCYRYAEEFTARFGSLLCRELRPGGFQPSDPPHACEGLTVDTVLFAMDFMQKHLRP